MKIAEQLHNHLRNIDDLVLLPGNPRQGDVGAISVSLERFGQLKPIVVDADDVILAGNHTYLAAKALGWDQIAAVTADDLEGGEKSAFALADNRLSDLAHYDDQLLLDMATFVHDETGSLVGTGYDTEDLHDLASQLQRQHLSHSGQDVPPRPSEFALGDEIELGDHLLIVGDATDPAYARTADLMFADPPYNVDIQYGEGTDDNMSDDAYEDWTSTWWKAMNQDRAIVTTGWRNLSMTYRVMPVIHTGVWLKRNSVTPGPISMFSVWEPICFIGSGFKKQPMRNDDVFQYPMSHPNIRKEGHPVPKPLAMIVDFIESFTEPGDIVFDPFGGSGTTLIACQQTGRRCVMLEIEPGYCEGIIERYDKYLADGSG